MVGATAVARGLQPDFAWSPLSGDHRVAPDHLADAFLPGAVHEVCAGATDRRSRGAWYTPRPVVAGLIELVWSSGGSPTTVLDPCAGGGAMLLAVADRLVSDGRSPADALPAVSGTDIDQGAAAAANLGQWWWAAERGVDVERPMVRVADALADPEPLSAELVLGNPPFGSPLRVGGAGTAGSGRTYLDAVRSRHPDLLGPYADVAAAHLLATVDRLAPGARVAYVLPQSVFASRGTEGLRRWLASSTDTEALWISAEPAFAAGARVGAIVLRRRPDTAAPRPSTVTVADRPSVRITGRAPAAPRGRASWSRLAAAALGATPLVWSHADATVGSLARTTAGFRDEYYAIAAAAREGSASDPGPRIVTVGAVDPLHTTWADEPVRLRRRDLMAPVLDADALPPAVRRWWDALARPKLVVATQSRVLEPVVDADGSLVPVTPLIAVVPEDPADLDRLAAVLLAPAVSRWLWERRLGTALSTAAITARAADIADIPLPAEPDAWERGAAAVRSGDLAAVGEAMTAAYRSTPEVSAWWRDRLGGAGQPDAAGPNP